MDYTLKYLITNGVLIITFLVSTPKYVEDEARQEDEHMTSSKTTSFSSTNQAGK